MAKANNGKSGRRANRSAALPDNVRRVTIRTAAHISAAIPKHGEQRLLEEMHQFLFAIRQSGQEAEALGLLELTREDIITNADDFSAKTLQRAFADCASLNATYLNTLYFFIRTRHDAHYRTVARLDAINADGLVNEFRAQLAYPAPPAEREVLEYAGRYELVRLFPYRCSDRLLAGELRIGGEVPGNAAVEPLACAYDYRYRYGAYDVDRQLRGKLIVHGPRATILLSNESHICFLLYIDCKQSREPGTSFAGIALTDTMGSDLASAWPFHARSLGKADNCRVGILEHAMVSPDVLTHLKRGIVQWNAAQYPGFPDAAGAK